MNLLKTKNAKLNTSLINTAVLVIVLLVVLFQVYASIVPEAQAAGDLMNDSNRCVAAGCYWNGSIATPDCYNSSEDVAACSSPDSIPFSGLFGASGVVFVIIMAALIVLVVRSFMSGTK